MDGGPVSAAGSGWQPISTAPLGFGDVIMGARFNGAGDQMDSFAMFWSDEDGSWVDAREPDRLVAPDGWRPLGGES